MNLPPAMPYRFSRWLLIALTAGACLATHAADAAPPATNAAPAPTIAGTNNPVTTQPATQATPATPPPTSSSRPPAPASPVASTNSFDRFRLLAERNIFNANRTRASRPANGESKPAPKIEAFALAGVMSYQKGTFAFFDSTSTEFKKTLKTGERIGGCQIHEITPNQVTLKLEEQTLVLKPGQQLKREDGGVWQVVQSGDRLVSSGSSTASTPSDSDSPEPSGPASDILKKLMERRAKELNP